MSKKTKNNLYPVFHRDGKLFIIDDVIEIADEIKNMPEEEMDREIARLEAEGRRERERIRREKRVISSYSFIDIHRKGNS